MELDITTCNINHFGFSKLERLFLEGPQNESVYKKLNPLMFLKLEGCQFEIWQLMQQGIKKTTCRIIARLNCKNILRLGYVCGKIKIWKGSKNNRILNSLFQCYLLQNLKPYFRLYLITIQRMIHFLPRGSLGAKAVCSWWAHSQQSCTCPWPKYPALDQKSYENV